MNCFELSHESWVLLPATGHMECISWTLNVINISITYHLLKTKGDTHINNVHCGIGNLHSRIGISAWGINLPMLRAWANKTKKLFALDAKNSGDRTTMTLMHRSIISRTMLLDSNWRPPTKSLSFRHSWNIDIYY